MAIILRAFWRTRFFEREKTSDTARNMVSTSTDRILGKGRMTYLRIESSSVRNGSNPENAEKLRDSLE